MLTTLKDNGFNSVAVQKQGTTVDPTASKAVIQVVPGRYSGVSSIAAGSRFEAGKLPYNAIQVSLKKRGTLYFSASMMEAPVIGTTATASAQAEAAFSIGSRLASVNGGILNALLGGLLGSNISLSVMDYNALISADIDVLSFTDQLATELKLTGVSYSDVLASRGRSARSPLPWPMSPGSTAQPGSRCRRWPPAPPTKSRSRSASSSIWVRSATLASGRNRPGSALPRAR
ncbi:hypothetical protein AJ88_08750 [Mesorhizobium amorphae CCBAU 01583]|nr:hypothetical protein AJ88_08750 [Mesorhizobium amorphae CCBAU 01583]